MLLLLAEGGLLQDAWQHAKIFARFASHVSSQSMQACSAHHTQILHRRHFLPRRAAPTPALCKPSLPAAAVIFCAWVLPWVGPHISWAVVAISAVWITFSLSMLAITAFTDPGFIPRSPPDQDVEYG